MSTAYRRHFKATLLILALCLPGKVFGSSPSHLSYYELGTAQGLAGSTVTCILQDRRGLMWFGAEGGLSCYDGHSFTTYRPQAGQDAFTSSRIRAMTADRGGGIWVAAGGGALVRFDPATGRFETAAAAGTREKLMGVTALAADMRGRIFAAGPDGGIYMRDAAGGEFSRIASADAPVLCLLADSSGRLWAGTRGQGLRLFDTEGSSLAHYRRVPGDRGALGDDTVTSLFEDTVGGIWIGLGSGGVDVREEDRFRHARPPEGSSLPGREVLSLAEDPEGSVWVGYARAGTGSLDPSSLVLSPPPAGDDDSPLAIFRDRRGLMWMGLAEGGVRSYNVRSALFSKFGQGGPGDEGLRDLRCIAQEGSGKVLAGAGGRVVAIDPRNGRIETAGWPSIWPAPRGVRALVAARDGSLWVGTEGGGLARRLPGGSWRLFGNADLGEPGSGGDTVDSLFEDGDGSIWIGMEGGGLVRFDPAGGGFSRFLPGRSVRGIVRDSRGCLWAASTDGGLACMEAGSKQFVAAGPLGDDSVNCVFEDSEGNLWIGTGGDGLALRDPDTGRFTRIRTKPGQLGDSVYAIAEDRGGVLWILSSRGLSSYDHKVGAFFLFGAEDGLASGDLALGALFLDSEGRLWIGGRDGLVRFDPGKASRYAPQPDVVIAGIEQAVAGSAPIPPGGSQIVLDHDNAGLVFRIAVIDYIAPQRNIYAVRLEGRQSGWTSLGTQNSGYLAPLAPGRYTLRARGSNGNGVWNDYGASLAILVRPPFWSTWWFRALAGGLVSGILTLLVVARIRSLRRRNALLAGFARHIEEAREEERKIAARDVHDEIGQDLMVLNFHTFWLASHPEAPVSERAARVKDMQTTVLGAMDSVKAVATRLRPTALDALDFAGALRWYARSFERMSGMKVVLEMDDPAPQIEGEKATALFRVAQEMLSNVMRHSGAATATVRLMVEGGDIVLEVADDGRGIEISRTQAPDSYGIIGMRERCRAFGGSLHFSVAPGGAPGRAPGGTLVRARVPLASRDPHVARDSHTARRQ